MFGIVPPHLLLKITKTSDHSRHKVSPLEKQENALKRGDMDGNNRGREEKRKEKIKKTPTGGRRLPGPGPRALFHVLYSCIRGNHEERK